MTQLLNTDAENMLEDKAKDLGRSIGQSAEYKALKRATDALSEDRETSTLLQQMETVRTQAQTMLDRGEQPTPEMEAQLDSLLEKAQVQGAYQRAVAAQDNYEKLMMRVNTWIAEGVKAGAQSSIILG